MDDFFDNDVSISKSINFPYQILKTIDMYGRLKRFSRTQIVVDALREYIKNHKVNDLLKKASN